MEYNVKKEITEISMKFASGLKGTCPTINGSGFLIVDPLSALLNVMRFENVLFQIPKSEKNDLVLVMKFKDGTMFIPAGKDLKFVAPIALNWMWMDK